MSMPGETLELLLEDLLFEDRFTPGLHPRDHRAALSHDVTAEPVDAMAPRGDCDARQALGDLEERQAERLLHELMSRREERPPDDEEPDEADDEPVAAPRPDPSTLPPEARHNIQRLERASRDVEAVATYNAYQAELKTVTSVIVDHMFGLPPSGKAEFERWWAVLEIYRRVLTAPEMTTSSARTVLPRLLGLEHSQLTGRRLEHVLGRRKRRVSRKRTKKRPRHRKKQRRSRDLPRARTPIHPFTTHRLKRKPS